MNIPHHTLAEDSLMQIFARRLSCLYAEQSF
jgi:hypothetical protein